MKACNFDLHNHSNASDGTLSPTALVNIAIDCGCDALALTDHDTTAGLKEAQNAAVNGGIQLIRGVEISVSWPGAGQRSHVDLDETRSTTIHIVGLNIDPDATELAKGLASIREGRLSRARRIGEDFERVGINGLFDDAFGLAENKEMMSRTHFARALVQRGEVKSVGKAFERFLTAGKPGYVTHVWASLSDAVAWIVSSGGIAVLAHPGRYKITPAEMRLLIAEFHDVGGRAIEVVTGSHLPHHYREYGALATEFGLMASRGADFHGPGEGPFQPGELPPLPSGLIPVWDAF